MVIKCTTRVEPILVKWNRAQSWSNGIEHLLYSELLDNNQLASEPKSQGRNKVISLAAQDVGVMSLCSARGLRVLSFVVSSWKDGVDRAWLIRGASCHQRKFLNPDKVTRPAKKHSAVGAESDAKRNQLAKFAHSEATGAMELWVALT